ncbi:MAG: oligosaccharide flippase family protein [Chromatiaceae bacterium]|nr:oligosaccharide flippase family protein [Chromatiaceae bacterium]
MISAQRVLGSSALLVAIKLIHRSLGLISTLVLARLLTPTDFGLVALVSIIVYFFDVLSSTGSDEYIIRKADVSRDDLDTAWTLDQCMKWALWLLLQLTTPAIATFLEQPALENALRIGAFVLPINALASARINLLKQDLRYRGIFWLSVIQRAAAFLLVIALAWHWQNYWAMIVGDLFASLLFAAGSYRIAPHRPRLTLLHARQQWAFSSWMLFKGVIGYTRSQVDTLFVSKLFPAATLGQYHMARDIAMLPAHNVVVPGTEPLLAMFRLSREAPETLARHLRISLSAVAALIVPAAVFIACFAKSIVQVLLGPQWTQAAPILASMSLLLLYFCHAVIYERLLVAHGWVRLLFALDVLSLLIVAAALALAANGTAADVALFRGLAGCLNLLILASICHTSLHLKKAMPWWPFAVIAIATSIAVLSAERLSQNLDQPLAALAAQISTFGLVYLLLLGIGVITLCRTEATLIRELWRQHKHIKPAPSD